MSICKLNSRIPFPYSPVGENNWFNVPKHIFLYDDRDNTGYFHAAINEVVKPIFLLFNSFHWAGIFQFTFNPAQGERWGSAKRFPASYPRRFWLLILIIFIHGCKISGPYLILVSNYWTWNKTIPQKNKFFWSNLYKIPNNLIKVLN